MEQTIKYFNMFLDAVGFAFCIGSIFVLLHIAAIYLGVDV